MARVQLALNVTDLDAAVEFYSSLFGTGPAKRRPGYANFAIATPPLKLVLIEDRAGREDGVAGALNHLGIEVETADEVRDAARRLADERSGPDGPGRHHVLLRRAGQGLGQRSRRCSLGGLHGAGRRRRSHRHGLLGRDLWPAAEPRAGGGPTSVRDVDPTDVAPSVLLSRARVGTDERPRAGGSVAPARPGRRVLAEALGAPSSPPWWSGRASPPSRLSPGDTGLQLLENAAATAAGLYAIILMFGPVSGGHFNPVVSLVDAWFGGIDWRTAGAYLPAQVAGCIGGAVVANLMFSRAAVSISTHVRASPAHFLSEVVATLGLIMVIFALARSGRARYTPAAVAAYIGAGYFFTSSTSFANPAITVGRVFSDTFAGIAPSSVPSFVAAQLLGGTGRPGPHRPALRRHDDGPGLRHHRPP